MPTCQNCGEKWTWKQTIKTLFRLKCPYCGEKQYEAASSRLRNGVLSLLPLVVLMTINVLLDISIGLTIIIGIVVFFLIIIFYPFILKLSNEPEPYW